MAASAQTMQKTQDPFNWPMPNRSDLMSLQTMNQ